MYVKLRTIGPTRCPLHTSEPHHHHLSNVAYHELAFTTNTRKTLTFSPSTSEADETIDFLIRLVHKPNYLSHRPSGPLLPYLTSTSKPPSTLALCGTFMYCSIQVVSLQCSLDRIIGVPPHWRYDHIPQHQGFSNSIGLVSRPGCSKNAGKARHCGIYPPPNGEFFSDISSRGVIVAPAVRLRKSEQA